MKTRAYVCADCGAKGEQVGRGPTRKRCAACACGAREYAARRARNDPRVCEACGQTYLPCRESQRWCSTDCGNKHKSGAGPRGGLSPEARERQRAYWQEKNRHRRAVKRGGHSEPYTTAEIAARDRFRCGLCGGRVAMGQTVPHPKAPTIDHIVPISDGGDDTKANVQLAHFHCNSVKGSRGSQQLALIG